MVLGELDSYMQKNETEPTILHRTQKSTQNRLKTWMLDQKP